MISSVHSDYGKLDVMSSVVAQLQCPKCGAGLSYTALYPRWWAYEAFFPELKVPVARICGAVVLTGGLLAVVHPVLAAFGVLGVGSWASYRYFGALQCDGCGSYFIRGQFNRDSPRTHGDSRSILRYALLAAAIIVAISVAVFVAQRWYASACDLNCGKDGLRMETKGRLFECKCIAGKT
jgi:hypothetical protein